MTTPIPSPTARRTALLSLWLLPKQACGLALRKHPLINARYDASGGIMYNNDINVAQAVALEGGLITPTLKNADSKPLDQLSARRVVSLSLLARAAAHVARFTRHKRRRDAAADRRLSRATRPPPTPVVREGAACHVRLSRGRARRSD